LVRELQKSDVVSFFDVVDIASDHASSPELVLESALNRSDALVLLLEENAYKSKWVAWELTTFLNNNPKSPVIPVWLDGRPDNDALVGSPFESLGDRLGLLEGREGIFRDSPSAPAISAVLESITFHYQNKKRRRFLISCVCVVVCLLCLAFALGILVGRTL
jgi:hypothetical protein